MMACFLLYRHPGLLMYMPCIKVARYVTLLLSLQPLFALHVTLVIT